MQEQKTGLSDEEWGDKVMEMIRKEQSGLRPPQGGLAVSLAIISRG